MTLRPGSLVGNRYELLDLLGEGAMGQVFRAKDTLNGSFVALKTITADCQRDAEAIARFSDEAKVCASLRCPGVVLLRGHNLLHTPPFLVFDLVEGASFSELLEEGVAQEEALCIIKEVAQTLVEVHHQGVIHRDLKPENILVTKDGKAIISDFGLAKAAELTSVKTKTGKVVGTLLYMAPERLMEKPTTSACDVYAIGVMLYEVLAQRTPFIGVNPIEVAHAHIKSKPPPLKRFAPNCSPQLIELVNSCLQKDPSSRPTSSQVFVALDSIDLSGHQEDSGQTSLVQSHIEHDAIKGEHTKEVEKSHLTVKHSLSSQRPKSRVQAPQRSLWPIVIFGTALLLFLYVSFKPKKTQTVEKPTSPSLPKLIKGPFLRGGLGWLELWCHLDKEARVTFVLEQCPSSEGWSKRKEAKGVKPKVVLRSDEASRTKPANFTVAVYYRGKLLGRAIHVDREKRLLRYCGPSHSPSSIPHFYDGKMYLGEWDRILHAIDLSYPQDYTIVADFTQMGTVSPSHYGQVPCGFLHRKGTLYTVLTSPHVELLPLPPFAKLKKRALSAWQDSNMTKEKQRKACLAEKIPAYANNPMLRLISEDNAQPRPRLNGTALEVLADESAYYVAGNAKGQQFLKIPFAGNDPKKLQLPKANRHRLKWVGKKILVHMAFGFRDADSSLLVVDSQSMKSTHTIVYQAAKTGLWSLVKDKLVYVVGTNQLLRFDTKTGRVKKADYEGLKACPKELAGTIWTIALYQRGAFSERCPILLQYDFNLKKLAEYKLRSVATVESVGNCHIVGISDNTLIGVFSDRVFGYDLKRKVKSWDYRIHHSTCHFEPLLHNGTLYVSDKVGILALPLFPRSSQ